MIRSQVTVGNRIYQERSPMARLVNEACSYECEINIILGNRVINAKSIMGMMTLLPERNEVIEICANGQDEQEAVQALSQYIERN